MQIALTVSILLGTIFVLGFIADPILNLYLDPYDTITSLPTRGITEIHYDEEDGGWPEHFLKGLASLGLLGMVKAFFMMPPWQWWNIRHSGVFGGSNRGRRAGTGRDRLENISWTIVLVGVVTFMIVSGLCNIFVRYKSDRYRLHGDLFVIGVEEPWRKQASELLMFKEKMMILKKSRYHQRRTYLLQKRKAIAPVQIFQGEQEREQYNTASVS